jgi:UDP-N-acetyl-D-glucosamine dehydrogenase
MKQTAMIRRRLLNRSAVVGIVGQGYVGLSLACAAAEAGFQVNGVDVDAGRVDDLNAGVLSVAGVSTDAFESATATGKMTFFTDASALQEADVIIVCVPTPLRDQAPDLSYITGACTTVAEHLQKGQLVVLESTTYPGTTDELVRPLLETSGLSARHDFLLAYSPERIDPGNLEYDFRSIPRVVGGMTGEATGVAALFYGQITDKVFVVSSCRAAELAKLLENTFRHVNIALVNEMAMMCHEVDIDVWEVIDAAASKPFGFMPFYPGPGVGGHCIPLDPAYLAWQVRRDVGHQLRILEQAQDINVQMPSYTALRISEALNTAGKPVRGSKVLFLGVTYKPDVGDTRESPALTVMNQLAKRGADISFHDPYVEEVEINGKTFARSPMSKRTIAASDCTVLLTPHKIYDLDSVAESAAIVFDARNAYGDDRRTNVIRL